MESDEELDFFGFSHRAHAGIVLDGVGDASTLLRKREVLQGRPKRCRGGRSATMVYAYSFTLARRAVVVTMDLSAAGTSRGGLCGGGVCGAMGAARRD